MLKVFKFGGASIKNADALRNLVSILLQYQDTTLVVVLSAMGKSTNALETLLHAVRNNEQAFYDQLFKGFKNYHRQLVQDVFTEDDRDLFNQLNQLFSGLDRQMKALCDQPYDFHYDQTICFGELISTAIVHAYLNKCGLECRLLDARTCIKTDGHYRAANVNWSVTENHITTIKLEKWDCFVVVVLLVRMRLAIPPRLGKEGSDYTAAISLTAQMGKRCDMERCTEFAKRRSCRFGEAGQLTNISYGERPSNWRITGKRHPSKTIKPPRKTREYPCWFSHFLI